MTSKYEGAGSTPKMKMFLDGGWAGVIPFLDVRLYFFYFSLCSWTWKCKFSKDNFLENSFIIKFSVLQRIGSITDIDAK